MRLYYNLTTIYDLPPTMSAEIIKLRERAKGLLTVRFGRPFVSLLLAPKHTTNSSLPKLMPQYVDALQKTTNLARMQKLADAAETLRDRSKDPDTILASVLAVKKSVVPSRLTGLLSRSTKKKKTPPPSPKTTAKDNAKDNATIIALKKQAEDCKEELQQVNTELLRLKNEKANIDADNKEKINELKQQIEKDEKKCKGQIEELKKKLEAAEKTNLKSVPNDKVEQMKKDAVKKIEENFESEKKTLEKRIEILQKAQTASTASVNAKIESLTTAKTKLEGEKNQLAIKLEQLKIDNSALEESNRTLEGERDTLALEKDTLDNTVKKLQRDSQREKTTSEKQTNKLKKTNTSLKNKNKSLEAYLEQIRARLELSQKEKAALEREVLTLKSDESSSKKVKKLERDLEKAQREEQRHKDNLKKQQDDWAVTKTLLNSQYEELFEKNRELQKQNETLENNLNKKNRSSRTSTSSGSGRQAFGTNATSTNSTDSSADQIKYTFGMTISIDDYEEVKDGPMLSETTFKRGDIVKDTTNDQLILLTEKNANGEKWKGFEIVENNQFTVMKKTNFRDYVKQRSRNGPKEPAYKIAYKKKKALNDGSNVSSKQGPKMPVQDIELGDAFSEELVPALPKIHIPSREEMD